ncbi:hypothetical protein pb186bvf_016682 [Paramecium bursaria]
MALATKAHQDYKLVPIEEAQAVAWSFEGPHTQPTKYPLQFPELRPDEIRVKQTYFGLCYTDCHLVNEDWFPVNFPIVPGHEILGRVVAVGSEVVNHKVGDLVGLGFIRDNCGKCNICWTGNDNICQSVGNEKLIPIPKFGGFATHVQAPAKWAFSIPSTIPEEVCPPLLCAGVTVWAPLKRYFQPHHKVAIVGIGGLGHLAIKFSAKLGNETWAISSSPDKEAEAKSYGAAGFLSVKDKALFAKHQRTFDVVLFCANANSTEEFQELYYLTKPGGTFILVGIPDVRKTTLQIPFFELVVKQINIVGSLVGSKQENIEMLEFAAKHKIYPTVELFNFEDFGKAYDRILNGKPHYRVVVKVGNSADGLKQ